MPIAAVPRYIADRNLADASPGMRFGTYLPIWQREDWSRTRDPDWRSICRLSSSDQDLLRNLNSRQNALAGISGESALCLSARATAPFTTGLGNEHPLENGFAFLWPYGLPYLPGSGVKGVVRRAACELAKGEWGDTCGWSSDERHSVKSGKTVSDLDLLFGLESGDGEKEHFRGVLTFWDVIPEIRGDLAVDVMTPHQKHYYQEGQPPHDSGQPIPVFFLTVPAGSMFHFHVTCDLHRMRRIAHVLLDQEEGVPRWQALLADAFELAFDWLGFGAKTAVGHGAMARDRQAELAAKEQAAVQLEEREKNERLKKLAESLPEDALWIERQKADGTWSDNNAFLDSVESFLDSREALSIQAFEALSDELHSRWKGIMENPDATQGKKAKPRYKPRPKLLAKRLLELRP